MIFVESKTVLANAGSTLWCVTNSMVKKSHVVHLELSWILFPWSWFPPFVNLEFSSLLQRQQPGPAWLFCCLSDQLRYCCPFLVFFIERSWRLLYKCNLHSSPHRLPLLVHVQDHPRVWVTVGSVTTWAGWMNKVYFVVIHDDDHSVIRMIWKIMKITTVQMYVSHTYFDWWRINVKTWIRQQVIWL